MTVTINNLIKTFGQREILNIPNMMFTSGKIYAILGDNGQGKTTLMRILSGHDSDFTGDVLYDNKPLTLDTRRSMTLVFQEPLALKMSVIDNVAYPLKIRGIGKTERQSKALELLNKFGIAHLKDNTGTLLSGGEKQKMALARALILEPTLLMLDEPFSSVDKLSEPILENIIADYACEQNACILLVTHKTEQAERLCDEFIEL